MDVQRRTTRERKTKIALIFFIRDFLQLRQPDSFAHRPLDRDAFLQDTHSKPEDL